MANLVYNGRIKMENEELERLVLIYVQMNNQEIEYTKQLALVSALANGTETSDIVNRLRNLLVPPSELTADDERRIADRFKDFDHFYYEITPLSGRPYRK